MNKRNTVRLSLASGPSRVGPATFLSSGRMKLTQVIHVVMEINTVFLKCVWPFWGPLKSGGNSSGSLYIKHLNFVGAVQSVFFQEPLVTFGWREAERVLSESA